MQNCINTAVTESHQTLKKDKCVVHILLSVLFAFHFYPSKVETNAEYVLWSKAPWRHSCKPIPSLFIALRSEWKDEIPQRMQNNRQKHNLIFSQQARKNLLLYSLVLKLISFGIIPSDCSVRWFSVRKSLRSHFASGWRKEKTIWGVLYSSSRLCFGRTGSVVWGSRWVFGDDEKGIP